MAMQRYLHLLLLLSALWLSGCAAITAVSVVPGALFEVVATEFKGKEKSFPRNIHTTLAALQVSLSSMKLDVDVLEIEENGYAIAFGNENLDGEITLAMMTPKLTTVNVKVRRKMREASVEQAIIESLHEKLQRMGDRKRFRYAGYRNLRSKPDINTARLGWYRHSAKLNTQRNGKSEWVRLKLPSGKTAYLKDSTINLASN